MPQTEVVFFAEEGGSCPLIDWLFGRDVPRKAQMKCLNKIDLLKEHGHELRRPHADLLRDGIHELRSSLNHVNYRMLYFFHNHAAVITHGCTKEDEVPEAEINLAVRRMEMFKKDPKKHTYTEEI